MSTHDSGAVRITRHARSAVSLLLVAIVAILVLRAVLLIRQGSSEPIRQGGAAAAAGDVSPTSTPHAGGDLAIKAKVVPNAQEGAQRLLIDKYGFKCLTIGEGLEIPPMGMAKELDRKIAAAGASDEGWVIQDQLWLGSPTRAAVAFGAIELFTDRSSHWMVVSAKTGPRAFELSPSVSDSGKVVWMTRGETSECVSEDPSTD